MENTIAYKRDAFHAYRLIIDIPDAASKKIIELQAALKEINGEQVTALRNAHIYLATFHQYEGDEQKLIDALHLVALGFMPYKIHLKNFEGLDGNELYIELADVAPTLLLGSKIKNIQHLMVEPLFNELPRVSLARKLPPILFEQCKKYLEGKSFSATFVASQMLLLKRLEGMHSWQVLRHLEFKNQLV